MNRRAVPVAVLLVCGLLTYHNTLDNGFHLDDNYGVVDNPGVETFWPPWRHFLDPRTISTLDRVTQYRPLLPLTLSLNHALFEHSRPAYHLVNLGIHLGAALLLYLLCLELLGPWSGRERAAGSRRALALVVGALFAVHPVSGIVVNYIVSRDLALMQCFLLAALLQYARLRRLGSTPRRWSLVLTLLALSLLSKTNAVVFPALVLLFEVLVAGETPARWRVWRRVLPGAGVVAFFFAFTRYGLGFSDLQQIAAAEGLFSAEYLLTQFRLHLLHYGLNFVWPFSLRPMPAVPLAASALEPGVLAGMLLVAGTLWGAWWGRRRSPLLSFCLVSYWALLIPTSSFLPLHFAAVDYRPYPASPFLYLAAALVAEALLSRRSLRLAVAVGAVAYFGLASVYLNRAWRTGESLWTHSVRHGGNATAHHSLAMCLVNRRDPRVRRHLEEALRLSPDYVMAHVNLGLLLVELGEVEEGLRHCARASRIAPDWAQPHFWTAQAYDNLGWTDQAARAAHRAAELDPRNLEYLLQAAHYAQKRGDFTRSLEHLDAIEAQQAGYGNNRYFAAFAHQMRGDVEGAKQALRRYLADYPTYAPAQFNLGYTLMEEGDCAAAIPHFEATLRARPDYPEAQTHLADCYARAARVGDRALGGRAAP